MRAQCVQEDEDVQEEDSFALHPEGVIQAKGRGQDRQWLKVGTEGQ